MHMFVCIVHNFVEHQNASWSCYIVDNVYQQMLQLLSSIHKQMAKKINFIMETVFLSGNHIDFVQEVKYSGFSGKNEFAPPGLEPGSSDCRSECSTTELQSETSFHRLCCAFL